MEELRLARLEYDDDARISTYDGTRPVYDKRMGFITYLSIYKSKENIPKIKAIKKILNVHFARREKGKEYTYEMFLKLFDSYGFDLKFDSWKKDKFEDIIINNTKDSIVRLEVIERLKIVFLKISIICTKRTSVLCKENNIQMKKLQLRGFKVNASNKFEVYIKANKYDEEYLLLKKIFQKTKDYTNTLFFLRKSLKEDYNCEMIFSKILNKDKNSYNKLIEHEKDFKIKATLIDSVSEAKLIIEFICDRRGNHYWL